MALTSFLALNARTTVHADTVQNSNANNNAITWDSDSDDSQVVKNESQQPQASQTVQKQASVQSNVQVKQTQPVQKEESQQDNATQNVQTQGATQDQKATQSVQLAPKQATVQSNVQIKQAQSKVAVSNVSSTSAVQKRVETSIVRQSNTDVRAVNRLNTDNKTVKVANVDATTQSNVSINKPKDNKVIVHFIDSNGKAVGGDYTIDTTKNGDGQYKLTNGYQTLNGNTGYNVAYATHNVHHDATGHYEDYSYQDGYTDTTTGNTLYGSNGEYSSSSGNEYLTTGSGVYFDDSGSIVTTNPDGTVTADNSSGGHTDITTYTPHYATGSTWVEDSPAYDETVVDKDSFTDKSGNVKSVTGNVVNIVVVKPRSVNDASQTRKSAERIIYVNLPDDQGARDRYKGLLNGNNQIVQTISFTRSITQDALTGNILSETNWQGPSSFPAVTLPDIPGYTVTMN